VAVYISKEPGDGVDEKMVVSDDPGNETVWYYIIAENSAGQEVGPVSARALPCLY
jgi:hypothetical protein